MSYQELLNFWFNEVSSEDKFRRSDSLDLEIKNKFEKLLEEGKRGELFKWRKDPSGRLAEIILLDQFSRHIFRESPKAFEADPLALTLAQEMVLLQLDETFPAEQKTFIYLPYMHSESPLIHEEAVKLYSGVGLEEGYKFELLHKEIIDRFGRYPHRNKVLGRLSTAEETEFLKTHSGF